MTTLEEKLRRAIDQELVDGVEKYGLENLEGDTMDDVFAAGCRFGRSLLAKELLDNIDELR